MRPEDFVDPTTGRLVSIRDADHAFVPSDLPPALQLDDEAIRLLAGAERALGALSGLEVRLPGAKRLARMFLRQEAVYSSSIEGTVTTFEQLALFQASPESAPPTRDAREVANYMKAAEQGIALLATLPPSLRIIKEVHSTLLSGVPGQGQPGEFRGIQVFIPGAKGGPESARYVPPPPGELAIPLDSLEKYMNGPRAQPELVDLALVHYQFEAIHPFENGNGRVGRMLLTLLMKHWGLLETPLLSISVFLQDHRRDYIDLLLRVSQRGDWISWVKFFLTGVHLQALEAMNRGLKLIALEGEYLKKAQGVSRSVNLGRLVEYLFEAPAVTSRTVQTLLEISQPAADRLVRLLQGEGILEEITGMERNRIYAARGVIRIMQGRGA
jgi:Fic family protein